MDPCGTPNIDWISQDENPTPNFLPTTYDLKKTKNSNVSPTYDNF